MITLLECLKKKSVWYVIIRAFREKMKAYLFEYKKIIKNNEAVNNINDEKYLQLVENVRSQMQKRLKTRLSEIQKWLSIDDVTVNSWEILGLAMNEWLAQNLQSKKVQINDIQHKFPVLWKRFLVETKLSDAIVPKFKQ